MGIDPGTTHSLIAVWEQGAARERMQTHPHLSTAAIKRHMGSEKEVTPGKRAFRAEALSSMILRSLKDDAEAALGQSVTGRIIKVPHRRPLHAAAAPPDTQK